MFLEVVVIASLVGIFWWWRRPHAARHARVQGEQMPLLPYQDLPPIGAFDPVPEESAFDAYVDGGLEDLTSYMARQDQAPR